jgi:hypothetical protein
VLDQVEVVVAVVVVVAPRGGPVAPGRSRPANAVASANVPLPLLWNRTDAPLASHT